MSENNFGYVGIRQESEFGEEATAPEAYGELLAETMKMDNNFIQMDATRGKRYRTNAIPGAVSASGGINLNVTPEGAAAWILKGLFGQVSSEEAAAGVFEHTFVPLHSMKLPSFNVDMIYEDMGQTWLGSTFSSAVLSVAKDQPMSLSLDVVSQRPKETTGAATPVFSSISPFVGHQVSFALAGESNLKFESFSISIRNNVETVYSMNRKRWCRSHCAHEFEMKGSITLEFETEAERRRTWGSLTAVGPELTIEPCSLTMTATHVSEIAPGHNYSLILDTPEIYFESAPANISREKDRVLQTLTFFPVYGKSAGKYADLVLRNAQSGYPDPA